jgi:hypothetical protein
VWKPLDVIDRDLAGEEETQNDCYAFRYVPLP